jgi:DNA-binding GntR family transcriptional regulator
MTPRQPLRIKIREHLLARILDGRYNPGDPIRELDVASTLGVSQGPVREALRELAATGLVEYTPNRGTRVRALHSEDLEQYYPVRAALEGLAGSLAAPHMRGATKPLGGYIEAMRAAADNDDLHAVARASASFHRAIVEAAHNRALLDAWQALSIEILTAVSLAANTVALDRVADEHLPIAAALNDGDARRAATLLRNHVGDYGKRTRATGPRQAATVIVRK